VPWDGVTGIRTPESLRHVNDWTAVPDVPAMRALHALIPGLDGHGPRWGPTGSAGFSLATGQGAIGPSSDLDIVIRCPDRPAPAWLDGLAQLFARQDARVDCQVETLAGLAHLDDLRGGGPSLVRTHAGPRLYADPWQEVQEVMT
jgi:phosphoribosyl-dephospho-CoA transferase